MRSRASKEVRRRAGEETGGSEDMDPTQTELDAITDLAGCFRWAGCRSGLVGGLHAAMCECDTLREAVMIPQSLWDALVQNTELHTN